jgi:acyl-CoA synthetase (NDP forming)
MAIANPLDVWPAGEKSGDMGGTYAEAIRLALADANADIVMPLINISYAPVTQSPEPKRLAQAIESPLKKPVLVSAIGSTKDLEHYMQALEKIRIPVYPTVKSCVLASAGLWKYSCYRNQIKTA